jgi:UDP:flavonoid glycosyltransferase YjiC (YdhE family)
LEAVGRECDLAILNGNHGLTAAMLLAGRPMLQLPIYLEQAHNALGAQRMGMAVSAGIDRPQEIRRVLGLLLESDAYRTAAEGMACKYSHFSAQEQIGHVLDRIGQLLN